MACVWTWAEIGTIFVAGGGDRGARAPGGAGGAVSAVWRRRETVSLLGSAGAEHALCELHAYLQSLALRAHYWDVVMKLRVSAGG